MSQEDYYSILGVNKNATKDEINKAYKKLVLKYHPDHNQEKGASEKFARISEAYSTLSNDNKRQEYNMRSRHGSSFNGGAGGFNYEDFTGGGFSFDMGGDLDDLFDMLGFSKKKKKSTTVKGEDISKVISLTLENIMDDYPVSFEYDKYMRCNSCNATGFAGGHAEECAYCKGTGVVTSSLGCFGYTRQTCPKCNGSRYASNNRCLQCYGERRIKKRVTVNVAIPHGINDNEMLQVTGAGNEGVGGRDGNLIINVKIDKHKIFERKDSDLYMSAHIPISKLVLGGDHTVNGICNEQFSIAINRGFDIVSNLNVSNKGMKHRNSQRRGSLYIKLIPIIPKNLSQEEEDMWNKIYVSENNEPPKKRARWW